MRKGLVFLVIGIILILVGGIFIYPNFFKKVELSEDYCDSLRGNIGFCNGKFSILGVRKFVCNGLSSYLDKDRCYYSLAVQEGKEEICEKIDYQTIKASCYRRVNQL
jgi:hypothetical protein